MTVTDDMLLQIDFKSGKPVYLQLVDQIRYAAASGGLRTGEPLPSIRPLAEELRVNRNTIAKAYAELESQGVIETIPGKGCFLKENNSPFTKQRRQTTVDSRKLTRPWSSRITCRWTATNFSPWSRNGSTTSSASRRRQMTNKRHQQTSQRRQWRAPAWSIGNQPRRYVECCSAII